ncbi:MAG: sulfatase-like hydrolase/transferase [Planctomycetota bacterium]
MILKRMACLLVRRSWLAAVIVIVICGANCVEADDSFVTDQPNVLFIFADDHSFDSVGALGNDEVMTPNIDSIARSGMTFTRAYNMGAWGGAVCVASRTMLNTGRFVWAAQRLDLGKERASGRTWAQLMSDAGYETYFTGKWHVKLKPSDLFDHVGHVRGGMPKQTPEGYDRPAEGNAWTPWDQTKGGFWEGGKHWSEVVADDTIEFLERAKRSEKPFFMYIAFNAPHDPRQSPQEFVKKYPADKIKIPVNFQSRYPYQDEIGCGTQLRDARLAPFPRTEADVRVHRQEYYAIITHMDREIGRILKALEDSGKSDSTYVFFTADHGLACGHHGLMGKQNMYEHSMRVPFFVRGPGVEAGKTSAERIYLQDVMATSLDLAGREIPKHVSFQNLGPMIRGEEDAKSKYDAIYGGYKELQRMVIKDDWKLILYPTAEAIRLYDLNQDPNELKDRSNEVEQSERIDLLFAEFKRLQAETGDSLKIEAYWK